MQSCMVDLQRQRAAWGERNFIERIKAPIFLEAVLVMEKMYEPQSNFEEKDNSSILTDGFFLKNRPIRFHNDSTSVTRPVEQNKLNFSSIEINKPLFAPVHSVSKTRFKFRNHSSCCCRSDTRLHLRAERSLYILTAIWQPHGQLWAILKGTTSLTWC